MKRYVSLMILITLILSVFSPIDTKAESKEHNIHLNFTKIYEYDQHELKRIKYLNHFSIDINKNIIPISNENNRYKTKINFKFKPTNEKFFQANEVDATWDKINIDKHIFNKVHYNGKIEENYKIDFVVNWIDNDIKNATGSGMLKNIKIGEITLFSMGPKDLKEIQEILKKKNKQKSNEIHPNTVLNQDKFITLDNPNENILYYDSSEEATFRVSMNRETIGMGLQNYIALAITPNNVFWGEPSSGYALVSNEVTNVDFRVYYEDGNQVTIHPYPDSRYDGTLSIGFSVYGFGMGISYSLDSYTVDERSTGKWVYDISIGPYTLEEEGGTSAEGYIATDNVGDTVISATGEVTWVEHYWREFSNPQTFYFTASASMPNTTIECVNPF